MISGMQTFVLGMQYLVPGSVPLLPAETCMKGHASFQPYMEAKQL